MKHDRNSVDRIGIYRLKDRVGRDAAKEADLLPEIRPHWILRTADDDVGLYADTAQLVNAVLRRFGLELSRGRYIWNERNVAVKNILPADTPRKLTYRLKIWKSLNIAYRAADLGNDDIITGADMLDPVLYFIRDMRYDLHCCAVIASRAFALYYGGINLAGGTAVLSQDRLVYETLIMPEVKISLRAVSGHKDLSMLEWAHRPRIDVDIGVHLYDAHPVTAALQQYTERRGGDPFSKRRNYPAGDKNILSHRIQNAPLRISEIYQYLSSLSEMSKRILRRAVDPYLKVHMVSRRTSGAAHEGDRLSLGDSHALSRDKLAAVAIKRSQPL